MFFSGAILQCHSLVSLSSVTIVFLVFISSVTLQKKFSTLTSFPLGSQWQTETGLRLKHQAAQTMNTNNTLSDSPVQSSITFLKGIKKSVNRRLLWKAHSRVPSGCLIVRRPVSKFDC